MALTERNTLADEVVGDLGSQHLGGESGGHLLGNDGEGGEDTGTDLDTVADGFDVVEHGLDALLQVLVVSGGQTLDGAHQAGHLTEGTASLTAEQLQAVY